MLRIKIKSILFLLVQSLFLLACDKENALLDAPIKQVVENQVTLNIMDFGADNTGKTDCSPAFDKLFVAMKQNSQVDVFLPAGKYKIGKRIVFDQSNFAGFSTNHGLVFRGAGEDVTELICDNLQGGFYFNSGTNRITVTVENLSFVTPHDNGGTAVEFNTANLNPGDHHARMFQARNLLIRGEKFDKGYFTNGILCYNAWYPMMENVKLTGRYGNGSEKFKMGIGYLFQDCYSPLITNCYFWGRSEYGLLYKALEKSPEDGIVKDCYFVEQDNGVYIDLKSPEVWAEPAFHITNSHINYFKNGVYLKGIRQVFISNNLFYCKNNAGSRWHNNQQPVSSYESFDVNCEYASDVIISHNQFTEPASPKRVAIEISENSSNILIDGNIFNFDATGIRNKSSKPSRCIGNVFGGNPSFTVGFVPYNDITGTLKKIDF